MRLDELVSVVPGLRLVTGADQNILRVVSDSRHVQPGDLFVAIPGERADGATYVPEAVARGAVAVLAERDIDLPGSGSLVVVPSARRALGDVAAALAGWPSQRLRLTGVTGTDGKTTTCQLIAHVLAAAGRKVGWLTTVDVRIGDEVFPNPYGYTTPEATEIQDVLSQMVAADVEDAIIEVSSHALAQDRVQGCTFDAAVFTNLSPEHLNFHDSMDDYAAAKARLFGMLDSPTSKLGDRMGVVNADDPASVIMATSSPAPVVSYGIDNSADVMATNLHLDTDGSRFTLVTPIDEVDVYTTLLGRHNVSNWLAAAAVALGWGIDADVVVEAAATAEAPAGRMQRVQRGQPFEVIVDFAHTPQALAATMAALSPLRRGNLYLAFGMPGGRYAANRPRMGELAARHATFFVISTDDPVNENPAAIASEVAAGARAAGAREGSDFVIELDRRAAIAMLLQRARPGDVVLLAAKGHEERQILADRIVPWSDVGAATELLTELGYGGL